MAKKDAQSYFNLEASVANPVSKKIKRAAHAVRWSFRLLVPDFLIGHPNLSDNVGILFKNPQFKPLRVALAIWVVFTLTVGSTGMYFLFTAHKTNASGFFMQTGYYLGTGATLSISGLGFSPQVVIIKSDTAAGVAIFKSSAMPSGEYTYWGAANADNTENQMSLDADGFTVQVSTDVNTANIRYTYTAFADSANCTSGGMMCSGYYSGNGAATQNISTGFQPDLVWAKRTTALAANFRTSAMAPSSTSFLTALADDTSGLFSALNSNSFTVGGTNNSLGGLYYFVAFKKTTNVLDVGSYTGNGTGQPISPTGLPGVTPNFVLTKQNGATAPAFNITQSWGDYSSLTTLAANTIGAITKLQPGGFVVGTSTNSNATSVGYQYFAFGPASTPSLGGSFTMRRGYYTGNGSSSLPITGIGFSPDLVMIKSDGTADYAVWSTSLDVNFTHYFANSVAGFAGGILGMNSDGFSVGASSTVNSAGTTYEYVAFGNATNPEKGAHAADFVVGAYTGNSINRSITNLGMTPDLVVTKENSTDGGSVWTASTLATGTTAYFAATADDVSGNLLTSIDSSGFTVSSSPITNKLATVHDFFAFKKGAGTFNIGSYLGNGTSTPINSVGFQPDDVWVKQTTAVRAVHRSSASALGTSTQNFTNVADFANGITVLGLNGFTVVSDGTVNTSGSSYRYLAWKASTPTNAPNTPTSSSPGAASTSVDLNPTLAASYSDSGGMTQTNAQWQVDSASDFVTPDWARTAGTAETSTVVSSSSGTFASTLAGKTGLNHNTLYYWRVRYSNGLYSGWSTPTTFTTNAIQAPANQSPTDGSTVNSLTPVLTASAFSDPQAGHTATSSEWQLSTSNSFVSPLYDSGIMNYGSSYAVPSAVLSNASVYYWRTSYQDSTGQWSPYSAPTRFLVSQSPISIKPLFTNTIVNQEDQINIDVQVKRTDESVINNASATITIYSPTSTKIVTGVSMTYVSGSNGVYRYAYTVPSANGSYLYEVTATAGSDSGSGAGNFQVGTMASDIKSMSIVVNSISTNLANVSSSLGTLISNVNTNFANVSSSLGTLISNVNTNASSMSSALATMSDTLNTLGNNLADTSSSLGSLIDGLSNNLLSVSSSLDSMIEDLSNNLTNASSSLGALINGVNANVISANGALAAVSSTLSTLSANLTNTSSSLGALLGIINTNVNNANGALAAVSSTLNTLGNNLANTSSSLGSLIEGLSNNLADTSSSLGSLIEGLSNNLADTSSSLGSLIDSVNGNVNNANNTLGTISDAVSSLGNNLTSASSSLGALLGTVNTNVNSANNALAAVSSTLSTLGNNLANTSSSLGSLIASNASNLGNSITTVNTNINNLSSSVSSQIQNNTSQLNSLKANMDVLIGAFIVTQSTVNDASPSSTRFATNLTNTTDDFYKNAVITFTSGDLNGQVRRISAYSGAAKTITADPAFAKAPSNGDSFTIAKQNVYVEEQMANHEASDSVARSNIVDIQSKVTDVQSKVTDIQTKVTDIQGKTNSMYSLLQTVDSNLDDLQASVNTIRASQEKVFSAKLSGASEIQAGSTYRAKVNIFDFESNPIDPASAPTIVIYDSSRNMAVATTSMARNSTGIYEYDYPLDPEAMGGSWEAVVSVNTGGSTAKTLNNYFSVSGAPAQVIINSLTSGVPTVKANFSIKNEGSDPTEYQYEYCIVSDQSNQCGGNDDISFGSASKRVMAGETFTTDVSLGIPGTGTYWFKITATYGGESSSASQQFTVSSAQPQTFSVSGGGGSYDVVTLTTVAQDIANLSSQMKDQSAKISKALSLIGNVDPTAPGFKSLLEISSSTTGDMKSIQNKISDLKAVSSLVGRVIEQGNSSPVIETYMKFNSVEIDFLISNPSQSAKVVNFKSFLPEEATPEIILDSSGLKVDYDVNAKTYFVSGDISLGPKQTVVKKVEMRDIWVFDETELNLLKQQADDLMGVLKGTQYESQGIILKDDIESTIAMVLSKQAESYKSPQDHIVAYRENVDRVNKVKDEIAQFKNLITQADSSKSIVGNIGGVQTVATWGIIIAVIFGFALLSAVIFALWKYQMNAMALLMGVPIRHKKARIGR
jgi:archaellum component FlaC